MNKSFLHKRLIWLSLICAIGLSLWLKPILSPATASGLIDPRVTRLESQVNALQNQINALQSHVSRAPNVVSQGAPVARADAPTGMPGELSLDDQFDNLATLVIELNQRVISIEDQLSD
ncbi:MAG: hypothetical protein AAFO84_11405 [Cyanobacteria bacterium J06598_1]